MAGPWDANWEQRKAERLQSADGVRGDPLDRDFGGYNLTQLPIVCDLQITLSLVRFDGSEQA